jgi:TonB family protein
VYPLTEVRDGREGWVQLNMMIDPKGKPYEVMVVDSSGNPAFEKAAMQALKRMSFKPAHRGNTPIDSSFMFKMKFAIANLATGASSEFASAYRKFSKAVDARDKENADAQLANLKPQNLYEEAFYHYGRYAYFLKWGTDAAQLLELRLAIAGEKKPEYLPREVFSSALAARFVLETSAGDHGNALETWETLTPYAARLPATMRTSLQTAADQIRALQNGTQSFGYSGEIDTNGYWGGMLLRNRFSIVVANGAVREIKLRCQKQYLFFNYQAGVEYSIGAKSDHCGIEVIGDPGTTFRLIQ